MKTVRMWVGGEAIDYDVEGETCVGGDEVLLDRDDNVIRDAPWSAEGFSVAPFATDDEYRTLVGGMRRLIFDLAQPHLPMAFDEFELENYHRWVHSNDVHLKIAYGNRDGFALDRLPIDGALIERRVSEICGADLLSMGVFCVRIVRPQMRSDNNPPHRDVWLDRLRNAVNIYLPIAGSNDRSSLPILPGSHLWRESDIERTVAGGKVQGNTYSVPAVTGGKQPIRMIRPDPKANELMVFSPYLIHGGGVNLNEDTTRMSLEMRFRRR